MILRIARRGRNVGKEFWGCSTYPVCKEVVNIEGDAESDVTNNTSIIENSVTKKGRYISAPPLLELDINYAE